MDCSVSLLFHRTPRKATKHGRGKGRIPTKFRKGKKLFKTTLTPLSLCVAHKIKARAKKEYITTTPPVFPYGNMGGVPIGCGVKRPNINRLMKYCFQLLRHFVTPSLYG